MVLQKFSNTNFHTSEGESIEILDFGEWNMNAGPDFLFAKIKIGTTILAGNIEIHVKSSDWYFHQHSGDLAYNNVILHVVYTDDMDIGELRDKNVPTLILKDYIDESSLDSYSEKVSSPVNIFLHHQKFLQNMRNRFSCKSWKQNHYLQKDTGTE